MTREELIRNLRYTMKKHKNDNVPTFGTNIFIMCKDILDYLEQEPCKDAHKKCHNINTDYAECDQFVCSNCGIELQDWHRVECDEDNGDITYYEYEFKYCPNCGAKIGGEE